MAEQGVAGFTGCFASAIGLAGTQAAAKYGIPFRIDSGIAGSLTSHGLTNTFRLFPTASGTTSDALASVDQIDKGAGSPAETAVLVHEDSEFGTNTARALAAKLEAIGQGAEDHPARDAHARLHQRGQGAGDRGAGVEHLPPSGPIVIENGRWRWRSGPM